MNLFAKAFGVFGVADAIRGVSRAIDAHAARTAPQCAVQIYGHVPQYRSDPSWWACSLPRGHQGEHTARLSGGVTVQPKKAPPA